MERFSRIRIGELLEARYCLTAMTFIEHAPVTSPLARGAAELADVDMDGDIDVLASEEGEIYWRANIDGKGTFGTEKNLIAPGSGLIRAADIDGDGDADVVASSSNLHWFENLDGKGAFGEPQLIAGSLEEIYDLELADLDGDGDNDLLVGADSSRWHENTDGKGRFGDPQTVSTLSPVPEIDTADMDGDGDLDLLTMSPVCLCSEWKPHHIAWNENIDGNGEFGKPQAIWLDEGFPWSVATIDVDNDGDLDVASTIDAKLVTYENPGQGDNLSPSEQFLSTDLNGLYLNLADINGDGHTDLLVTEGIGLFATTNRIYYFESDEGVLNLQSWQELGISKNVIDAADVRTADFDGDGDDDLFARRGTLAAGGGVGEYVWLERRLVGDSNDDGTFNSSDLTRVFQIGKYEDARPGIATFDDGDWNQDGKFNSSDIVLAFQVGRLKRTAAPRGAEIAAAVDWIFAADDEQQKPTLVA